MNTQVGSKYSLGICNECGETSIDLEGGLCITCLDIYDGVVPDHHKMPLVKDGLMEDRVFGLALRLKQIDFKYGYK